VKYRKRGVGTKEVSAEGLSSRTEQEQVFNSVGIAEAAWANPVVIIRVNAREIIVGEGRMAHA